MRVNGESGNPEGVAQHHIRRFPPDSGQTGQFIHGVGTTESKRVTKAAPRPMRCFALAW
jgi:hypothetical protein